MNDPLVNAGPLLWTLAVVFTVYFGAALAMPGLPSAMHHALALCAKVG